MRVGAQAIQRRGDGAEIDRHVLEGAGGDAARSITRREVDNGIVVGGNTSSVVRSILPVAADGSLTAIEEWRADDVVSILSPVYVRLISFVSALLA